MSIAYTAVNSGCSPQKSTAKKIVNEYGPAWKFLAVPIKQSIVRSEVLITIMNQDYSADVYANDLVDRAANYIAQVTDWLIALGYKVEES